MQTSELVGFNRKRAQTRYFPASTFKIPNSLIGLANAAVADVDEILPYGGGPQPIKSWERDMPLREAIIVSNVPVYQELARRIGLERMGELVKNLEYGNMDIGDSVDTFWLSGPLQITAIEQTQFLARLARAHLPVPAGVISQVHEITLLEQGEGWKLHGKTGWATRAEPPVGWWVGWVERGAERYSFALNIDIQEQRDLQKRIDVGKACLRALGVLDG